MKDKYLYGSIMIFVIVLGLALSLPIETFSTIAVITAAFMVFGFAAISFLNTLRK